MKTALVKETANRDNVFAILPRADCRNAAAGKLLETLYVRLSVRGKLFKRADARNILSPAGHLFINGRNAREYVTVGRHVFRACMRSVGIFNVVSRANRNGFKTGKNVQFCKDYIRKTVDSNGITVNNRIKPAAAGRPVVTPNSPP